MGRNITQIQTPKDRELEKKLNQLTALESRLAQNELDLATLHAELQALEDRRLRTVGVRNAEHNEIEVKVSEALSNRKPEDPFAWLMCYCLL